MRDGQTMNSHGRAIIAVSAVFSCFAIVSVFLRFLVKVKTKSCVYLDDYLILAGLIVTIGVTTNNILGAAIAGLGSDELYRTDTEAPRFPYPEELLPQGQVMFALQILHTCAMPLIKASILAFYVRIFDSRKWFKAAVWILSAYIFCWWAGILVATIFQCTPVSDNWGTDPSELNGCLPNISIMYETAAITNMFSDVFILLLPIPIIIRLHLLTKHKVAVLAILLTGSIVIVAGIGRTVAYFSYRTLTDFNYSSDYHALVIWTSLEPTLGVTGACLPCIRPAFRGWSPESIIRSVRSVISLRSLRSGGSKSEVGKGSLNGTRRGVNSAEASESMKGFTRIADDLELGKVSSETGPISSGTGMGLSGRAGTHHSYVKSVGEESELFAGSPEAAVSEGEIRVQKSYNVIAGGQA